MGKFNVNKIKGAGEGLLNEISKMQKVNEMQIIYILPDQIDKAEENEGISIDRIEELADSIASSGRKKIYCNSQSDRRRTMGKRPTN